MKTMTEIVNSIGNVELRAFAIKLQQKLEEARNVIISKKKKLNLLPTILQENIKIQMIVCNIIMLNWLKILLKQRKCFTNNKHRMAT